MVPPDVRIGATLRTLGATSHQDQGSHIALAVGAPTPEAGLNGTMGN